MWWKRERERVNASYVVAGEKIFMCRDFVECGEEHAYEDQ